MANISNALEERLVQSLLEQETKKNWEEWIKWLLEMDCPLTFEKPINLPKKRFNFQTWLSFCENQLINFPDWQARLSTPAWLLRQQVFVVPKIIKKVDNHSFGIDEIGGLNIELTRLIDLIHNVQKLITNTEKGNSDMSSKNLQDGLKTQIPSLSVSHMPASGLSDTLGRPDLARTLERELQLKKKESKEINDAEIVPLKEAYLSFNRWCDQFEEVHLDLQEFVEESLRVNSSHQISFQQFCHRILKKALDVNELKQVLESFSRLRTGGINKNLEEKNISTNDSEIINDT